MHLLSAVVQIQLNLKQRREEKQTTSYSISEIYANWILHNCLKLVEFTTRSQNVVKIFEENVSFGA